MKSVITGMTGNVGEIDVTFVKNGVTCTLNFNRQYIPVDLNPIVNLMNDDAFAQRLVLAAIDRLQDKEGELPPTETERQLNQCMSLCVVLWNTFKSIENKHSMDDEETARDIHDIQNRLASIANKNGIIIRGWK